MPIKLVAEEFIPTQREDVKRNINELLDDYMEPLMNGTIVAEIKSLAYAANMPQGFIDGVQFRRTEPNKGEIINTWGTDLKPLAIWFNYGTDTHWIEPLKEGGVLAFPAREGSNPSAIFFQGESREGDIIFSKGHYVAGVPRTEVMERGFQIGKKRLTTEAGKLVKREFE